MYKYIFISILSLLPILMIGQSFNGFYNFNYDDPSGKILLDVKNQGEEFLYVSSLATGVGSNDIGLDRGQLGDKKVVKFVKAGNKLLLTQVNYDYRAVSNNELEKEAVEQAFAQSVIWGFPITKTAGTTYTVDATDFLMRDAHQVAKRLKSKKQGGYKLDKTKSAIYLERCKSFPDNTEFEVTTTFVGEAKGGYIRSVSPDADIVSVRQHHSFIRLPDAEYKPRVFHPYSGFNMLKYADYATPIDQSLEKRFIYRHRLTKKNPNAALSEAVEPIIYYIDAGCPEPIKSALMEGGAWWNQAFTAAGFKDAFQVKELPEGADPMDVRYNMIQWVHRSTRGWSYGGSVSDPRTGEIIKGHVSLGSLRVRQDFMIAQGILSPFDGANADPTDPMMQLALARLRQLSAHEIGHTIGLAHNFAASTDGRASVMDYPHPVIKWTAGEPDFSDAYDTAIGDWDKRTIIYGYSEFGSDKDETMELKRIIKESQSSGYKFISDSDARPMGSLHPDAHLWDNGTDPIKELDRLMEVRTKALDRFGANTVPEGTPYSELEKVLVPVYLMHRYQVDAVSKLIGGVQYSYSVKGGDADPVVSNVPMDRQKKATKALLNTLAPNNLELPAGVIRLIPPAAFGYPKNRESFESRTGLGFDRYAIAASSIEQSLRFMLQSDRLSRLDQISSHPEALNDYLSTISNEIFKSDNGNNEQLKLKLLVQKMFVNHLSALATNKSINQQVTAMARYHLSDIMKSKTYKSNSAKTSAHNDYISHMIQEVLEGRHKVDLPKDVALPPGSPIGCNH